VGTEFREALGVVPGRHAWHVIPDGAGRYQETAIPRPVLSAATLERAGQPRSHTHCPMLLKS
jgi:hypothetical protein